MPAIYMEFNYIYIFSTFANVIYSCWWSRATCDISKNSVRSNGYETIFFRISFSELFRRKNKVFLFRSSHREVFPGKGVLKICSKFTEEHICRKVISLKLQSNFIEITLRHGCSPQPPLGGCFCLFHFSQIEIKALTKFCFTFTVVSVAPFK